MMCRNNFNYNCNCKCNNPCLPVPPRQNCIINVINPVSPPQQFLSSYLESSASEQTIASGGNVAFEVDPEYIDIVGDAISVNASGTVFTINKPGLYHIEWDVNLESGVQPIIIGVMENGEASTATSSTLTSGNVSCGALIYVSASEVPYTVSLHNYGGPITISDPDNIEGTAASIRILRFADGPE